MERTWELLHNNESVEQMISEVGVLGRFVKAGVFTADLRHEGSTNIG